MSKRILVLATRNRGKKREFKLLFNGLPLEIKDFSEFKRIPEFEEEGSTFEEIAVNKAKLASKSLDLPVIADDSGLVVDALHGDPGIFSARYAGKSATDYQNNLKLLQKMEGKANRNAIFVCSIAISKPTGQVLTYTGKCSGIILHKPAGTKGFGYDPFFYYPPLGKTFAQLSVQEKSRVSHRGQAMRKLKDDFQRIFIWMEDKIR
ncbi:MAG: XTP/dITP diphosphatase [Thermodesulfobacteriota bacterium]